MAKDLKREAKEEARRLGFDLVGVAPPSPSSHASRYRDWLARGYHAEMSYLARPDAVEKRLHPQLLMPGVRSILVVGMNYYPGDFRPAPAGTGRVSRYAWGVDYHDVIMERLQQLVDGISVRVGKPIAHRAYVDFGPLLERELAQRAGLGWFGKNTTLIHSRLGSYVFLADLLLDLELESDAPVAGDRCGACSACLDACPTGALVAPGVLDARRCISYLTIEHRGAIPKGLRPLMRDWVFGCDICQEVCPWNRRFAHEPSSLALDPVRPMLDLIELLALDERAFRTRFRDTPLWRPRRAGLLRNAAVVLGNLGDAAAVPALEHARLSEPPLIADHAAWALAQLKHS